MATITGTFTGVGQSPTLALHGHFTLTLSGTFVATVRLERSYDDGATWHQRTSGGTGVYSFTAPVSEDISENNRPVLYRLNCTAYTSGTVNYRLGN